MSDRHGVHKGATSTVARGYAPEQIRNIVLIGPSGSGKTTLLEALAHESGLTSRQGTIADHNTLSDFDAWEHAHQRSASLSVVPIIHENLKINVIDTPGYSDFIGEVRAGLRAADCALFVIAADESIDEPTRQLWRECAAISMPRFIVITKLDHPRADIQQALREAREAFGDKVRPLYVPVQPQDTVTGLVSLLDGSVHDHSGDDVVVKPLTETNSAVSAETITALRNDLIEGVIEESEDETLMDRYASGETIDHATLIDDLETAVARGSFHPVVPVCSTTGVGCEELLALAGNAFPAPSEHVAPELFTPQGSAASALKCDPAGPLVAEVVKTTTDPYVGRISIVRVFSGTLTPDAAVHVSGHLQSFFGEESGHLDHDDDERVGGLSVVCGKTHTSVLALQAGDIGAVARLQTAETGDTLSDKQTPRVLKPWSLPQPLLPTAIQAHSTADEDKVMHALKRLAAEDPTIRTDNNAETGQLVIWTLGETHRDLALQRLTDHFGVHVDQVPVKISLRETFGEHAKGHGRHVKQSGGHGQFAVVDIEVEPLPQGAGFEFVDKVVGGAVPRQFIGSVEKGIRQQMDKGVKTGYPMVDIKVTLTDGKAHSVDSSDVAFQTAGALALRDAAEHARIVLLEPVDEVCVSVPDAEVGHIMGNLSAHRGHVLGTENDEAGRTLIRAEVPQTSLVAYATELRSTTHGAGTFTRTFARYERMPAEVAEKLADH